MSDDADTMPLLQRWHQGDEKALATLIARDLPWLQIEVKRRMGAELRARTDADVVQQLECLGFDCRLFLALVGRAQHGVKQAGLGARVTPDHHVLERGEIGEEANVLKGARQSRLGDGVRF